MVYRNKQVKAKPAKKKGPGRPKRVGGRDPILTLRVAKAILAAIDEKAKAEGSTRSQVAAALLAEAVLPNA